MIGGRVFHVSIPFDALPWQAGGHPLERKKSDPRTPITLLEFAPGFADPNWCVRAHSGLVLSGTLRMEYGGLAAEACDYGEGQGFHIELGTPHRASNPGAVPVRLFIVSSGA